MNQRLEQALLRAFQARAAGDEDSDLVVLADEIERLREENERLLDREPSYE